MLNRLTINDYSWVILIAIGVWLSFVGILMIAPVWDEMFFWVIVNQFKHFQQVLYFLWGQCPLYRPLATSFLALELWSLPFDSAWPLLRILNAVMVLTSYSLIADAAKRQRCGNVGNFSKNLSQDTLICYWLAALLSPATLIVATWFANIFDASCLLLIAMGLSVWTRDRWCLAGCLFGLTWFCKEAAIFVLPLLVYLYVISPQSRKNTLYSLIIYMGLGGVYWYLRSRVVTLGSTSDIHPLLFSQFFSTVPSVAMRLSSPGITVLPSMLGLLITLGLLLSVRSFVFFGFVVALILCAAAAYQGAISGGMLTPDGSLINSAIFDARLFYIPLALFMFGLLLQGRTWQFVVLMFSFSASIPLEFQRYQQFQLAYQSYYQLAAQTPRGVTIYVDKASGVQPFSGYFGLKIGAYPEADYVMNPQDGSLTPAR